MNSFDKGVICGILVTLVCVGVFWAIALPNTPPVGLPSPADADYVIYCEKTDGPSYFSEEGCTILRQEPVR